MGVAARKQTARGTAEPLTEHLGRSEDLPATPSPRR